MCGESNADMPFVADGTDQGRDYVTYSYDVDGIDGAWQYVSKIFYFSNQEKQEEFFSNFKADAELPAGYFTTMNLYSEGEYYLDDIEIVKTTVAGITFNDDVIRVDFGYDTNIANLAKSTGSGVYE